MARKKKEDLKEESAQLKTHLTAAFDLEKVFLSPMVRHIRFITQGTSKTIISQLLILQVWKHIVSYGMKNKLIRVCRIAL